MLKNLIKNHNKNSCKPNTFPPEDRKFSGSFPEVLPEVSPETVCLCIRRPRMHKQTVLGALNVCPERFLVSETCPERIFLSETLSGRLFTHAQTHFQVSGLLPETWKLVFALV